MRTYPHHLTADLPPLPVPTLLESFERFRKATAALLDPAEASGLNQSIADFVHDHAPALQQTLEEYAATMTESGSNWMAEQWLERYLNNRDPLLLTDNVTYQLNLPTESTGIERIVELLQRIGSIHILQAKRDTPAEVDPKGRRMSMDSWADFNGGIRTPADEVDIWMRAGTGATYRTIGILYLGRMWEIPFTGAEGKLLDANQLRSSVEYVLQQTTPATQNFVAFSALGSEILAADAPWTTQENQPVYNQLANMLFTLTIDPDASDDIATLQRWAFQPGNAWVYKPISYLTALDSNMLAASLEHSVIDGGTLATAVTRMQHINLATLDTQHDAHIEAAQELVWHDVNYDLAGITEQSSRLSARRVVARRDEPLLYEISADARAQLILMIAQHLTFGTIRSHYESCDMRHYRGGRTETIRPVTMEALTFVTALVEQQATESQFTAAVSAHTDWIKAAKMSQVFDRHLFMMQYIGQELGGADAAIFANYPAAQEDFLSTSSLGTPEAIIRFVFAPTARHGFGVNYTTVDNGTEYVVTWTQDTSRAEEFCDNLPIAADLLYDFLGSLVPVIHSEH